MNVKDQDQLIITQDGSPSIRSFKFGATYHSTHGALSESQVVFISNGLHYVIQGGLSSELHVLELGFGSGLNAFLTLQASADRVQKIYYHTVEKYPLDESLYRPYCEAFEHLWTNDSISSFEYLHLVAWNKPVLIADYFELCKWHMDFWDIPEVEQYHLIYHDAFAPSVQSEFWEKAFLKKLYNLLKPGGILVSYCCKGDFRRALQLVGFQIEKLPGPPGKREVIRAIKS